MVGGEGISGVAAASEKYFCIWFGVRCCLSVVLTDESGSGIVAVCNAAMAVRSRKCARACAPVSAPDHEHRRERC